MGKSRKSTKHRKTRDFLAGPTLLRQGAAAPLSYGEERNAYGNATARGPLAGFVRLTPDSRAPAKADLSARAGVVVVGGGGGGCCCGCRCRPCFFVVVVVVVGRCWPYLGAGLPLS